MKTEYRGYRLLRTRSSLWQDVTHCYDSVEVWRTTIQTPVDASVPTDEARRQITDVLVHVWSDFAFTSHRDCNDRCVYPSSRYDCCGCLLVRDWQHGVYVIEVITKAEFCGF